MEIKCQKLHLTKTENLHIIILAAEKSVEQVTRVTEQTTIRMLECLPSDEECAYSSEYILELRLGCI